VRTLAKYLPNPLFFILLTVPVLFIICNPFFEIGVGDDWEYARLSRALAETGRFQLDGWTHAMALPQTIWGALIVKIAGFSFVAIRVSMIPIVLGCCVLIYAMARWLKLSPWLAGLTVAEVLLSPLFLPMGTTFMTDVPSLLFFLTTLYCALKAAEAPPRTAVVWIALAAVAGFIGGANRQVIWTAPAAMLGGVIVLRRRERNVVLAASLAIIGVILAAGYLTAWCAGRGILGVPKTMPEPMYIVGRFSETTLRIIPTLALFCLPALLFLFGSRVKLTRRALLACGVAAAVVVAIAALKQDWVRVPWLGSIVTEFGIRRPGQLVAGLQPLAISRYVTHALGLSVIALILFGLIVSPAIGRALRERGPVDSRLWIFAVIAVSSCALYLAGSLPSSLWPAWYFDRYLLPLIVIVNLGAMAVAARLPGATLRLAAVPTLLIFGVFGLAMTHDAFRLSEARARAADRLREIGVPRTCVSGGYEYDGWTQVTIAGHIGRTGSEDEVFHLLFSGPYPNTAQKFWFLPLTPEVRPRYFMATSPQPDLSRTVFTQSYRTWLPPRNRQILVQTDSSAGCT